MPIKVSERGEERNAVVQKLIVEVANNHAKILDDFCKAYLASRWKDYFSKQKKIDFRRIELCHQMKSPTENVYWFRFRKGRLPLEPNK